MSTFTTEIEFLFVGDIDSNRKMLRSLFHLLSLHRKNKSNRTKSDKIRLVKFRSKPNRTDLRNHKSPKTPKFETQKP